MTRTTFKVAAVALSLSAGAAATVAVRGFFDRPGESALRLVPADANMVVVEDLIPAPSQLHAFAQIERAIAKSKGQSLNLIAAELGEPDLAQAVGPYLGRSLAMGLYMNSPFSQDMHTDPRKAADGVVFVSLSDAASAKDGLAKAFKPVSDTSGLHYVLKDGRVARIAEGYLQLASKLEYFSKVDAIYDGKAKAIASTQSFSHARQVSDGAANVSLFFKDAHSSQWSTLTGSVGDEGIKVVVRGSKGAIPGMPTAGMVRPLPTSVLHRIPSGPYAVFSLAQLSSMAGKTMKKAGDMGSSIDSAFKGDMVMALYPSETKQPAGIDLLIIADSANGAKPGSAVKGLITQLEKSLMNGQHLFGKPTRVGSASVYNLSGQLAGMFKQSTKKPMPGVKSDILLKNKTVAFATQGENAYLCSSMQLLKRAISAAEGNSASIAKDAAFKSCVAAVNSGSQLMLTISFDRLIAGIENTVTKDNSGARKVADAIRVVTNGGNSLSISGGSAADGSIHGQMTVPLNYAKLADMVGNH